MFTPELQWQSRGKRRISQGWTSACEIPLRYCLLTPELQWQSRGKRHISQSTGNARANADDHSLYEIMLGASAKPARANDANSDFGVSACLNSACLISDFCNHGGWAGCRRRPLHAGGCSDRAGPGRPRAHVPILPPGRGEGGADHQRRQHMGG